MHTKLPSNLSKSKFLSGFDKNYLIWLLSLLFAIILTILGIIGIIVIMSYKTISLYNLSNKKIIESAGVTILINIDAIKLEEARDIIGLKNKTVDMPKAFRNIFFYDSYSYIQNDIILDNETNTSTISTTTDIVVSNN